MDKSTILTVVLCVVTGVAFYYIYTSNFRTAEDYSVKCFATKISSKTKTFIII